MNRKHLISAILILCLGVVIYANSLQNQFVWDDEYIVAKNTFIKSWQFLPKIFTMNLFAGGGMKSSFYRPIQSLTLLIDHSVWGLNPAGYHLTNTLTHIFNAILLYWLAVLLMAEAKTALLAALFFLVHPIQTQAVTYISGRADPLMVFFLLLSFILFVQYLDKRTLKLIDGKYLGSVFCFALALLSKEMSFIFPFFLLAYVGIFYKKIQFKAVFQIITFFAIVVIYLFFRTFALKTNVLIDGPLASVPPVNRLAISLKAFGQYIGLISFPCGLHTGRIIKVGGIGDMGLWISVFLLIIFIILIFKLKEKIKLTSFGLSWFIIGLLPVSNIYPLNASIAEHWLYLPSVGFFLAISALLSKIRYKSAVNIACIIILSILSVLTIRQNTYWRDPITFFQKTLTYRPNNAPLYFNLGTAYKNKGLLNDAKTSFEKVIQLDPKFTAAYNDLGNIYLGENAFDKAIEYYEKAAMVSPNLFEPYYNLGNACYRKGDYEKAIINYKKALALEKNKSDIHYNLAIAYGRTNQIDAAVNELENALKLNPKDAQALELLRELKR